VSSFELDWCEHAKSRVAPLAVVELLEILEDRVRQLDPGAPALPVQELDLHAAPERLDHGVVVAVPDRYEVIVTREDPLRVLDVTLSPEDTRLTVPAEFLDAGVAYKIEVHASDVSGNRIFTEVGFTVA
jgi:hypothetical protein